MHYRFFVTFAAEEAQDSEAARGHVQAFLDEEGFCSQGRWGCGMADWFVIGGRWSGELSRRTWAREITTQMAEMQHQHGVQVWGAFYGDAAKEREQEKLALRFQQLWDTAAPDAYKGIPYRRDTFQESGYADDAMLLTQELYDALLKEYEGQKDSEYHADLDWDAVGPDMVGKKWLVVVDYHN